MKVCCILVTYASRFHLLRKVVEEVLKQGVSRVVIVDNGSAEQSAADIAYLANNEPSVMVHRFPDNEGSSRGFKTGLAIAQTTGCDFIWILDDDNLPAPGVLQLLKFHWKQLTFDGKKEEKLALLCMRPDRRDFQKVLQEGTAGAILPPRNSFMGFHIREILMKLKERLFTRKQDIALHTDPLQVDAAPYGGLFFHQQMLHVNGLPDDSYVLYIDDFDFTFRYTRSGGEIWLIPECVIQDIDQSFYLPDKKKFLYHSTLDTSKDAFAYYVVRNSVYFASRNLVTSMGVFILNQYLFIIFITLTAVLRGKFKRLKLIYAAMREGMRGRMGKKVIYEL